MAALALDWLGGNLYWIDSGLEAVMVCRLEGEERAMATIISGNISLPRSLAVDPVNGFLFWTSWRTSDNEVDSSGSIR